MMNLNPKFLLASNSPRRKELMANAGYQFLVKTIPVEENWPKTLNPHHVPEFLSKKKNQAHREAFPEFTILTADTVVILDAILEKPKDENDAKKMLHLLSGKTHEVVTGVTISSKDQQITFSDRTEVTFKNLDKNEIDYYVTHFKPMDKAGAYGIQEWIGMIGIAEMKGSYYNVVGLPIAKVYSVLKENFGISPLP
jgi:septum formation protein